MNVVIHAGGVALLADQIRSNDAQILPKVARALRRGLDTVSTTARLKYLSGPRPQRLDVVTTRLRNSIAVRVVKTEDFVRGTIGTNVPYAAFHELGFHGVVNVSAHTRTVSETFQGHQVDSRRKIRDKAGNVVGYRETRTASSARKGTLGVAQQVRAHTRRIDYEGRPFLLPALKEGLPIIMREIKSELSK